MPRTRRTLAALLLCAATLFPGLAEAGRPSFTLRLDATGFTPDHLTVPAGRKIELHVINAGRVAAEFESADLNREKVVPAGSQVVVFIGPLHAGNYSFFNDFNPRLRGRIVAR